MNMDDKFKALDDLPKPIPGAVYRHSKTGNLYTVLHVGIYCGKHEEKDDPNDWRAEDARDRATGFREGTELVVYVGHYNNSRGNRIYIRPVSEWLEAVTLTAKDGYPGGVTLQRFVLV